MILSVHIAISLDGFIARKNGDIDWLPQIVDHSEDYGFTKFLQSVDALVMGRKTYEKVQTLGVWPYGDKHVVVLTNHNIKIPENIAQHVSTMSEEPQKIVESLKADGYKHLYIDGGNVIHKFLQANLINELTITTIPILLGSGIPLFGELNKDIELKLLSSKSYNSGLVQTQYRIK